MTVSMSLNDGTDALALLRSRMSIIPRDWLHPVQFDLSDLLIAVLLCIGTAIYVFLWRSRDPDQALDLDSTSQGIESRDIVQKMKMTGKNCVVFYGSQTGNAEDYASRLAQDGKNIYGLEAMVADLEDYDYDNLHHFPSDNLAIFVLATYGEGEPTDNAVDFHTSINSSEVQEDCLANLSYVIFGLGNSTYEHYNLMGRSTDKKLQGLGAQRIGNAGEGDDGKGTLEEDFLAWKDEIWAAVASKMGLKRREAVYRPLFNLVREEEELSSSSPSVYLGEPNQQHLQHLQHLQSNELGPFGPQNPKIASVIESRELFNNANNRNCIHLEIDIRGLSYNTGDHVAVWPSNPGDEVDRFLRILGLEEQRDDVITVQPLDSTVKVPFPNPTTFGTIARYQLEICAPVSRQFIGTLIQFAPNETSKAELARMAGDRIYFDERVRKLHHNIGTLLETTSAGMRWDKVPFSAFIEGLPKLQPRYYSISSSSLSQPDRVSITAAVESRDIANRPEPFKGVATNYLLALKQAQNGDLNTRHNYDIQGPRGRYGGIGIRIPIHIRTSNFRLPRDPSLPLILIGPGTGIAPMRAFVQERATLARRGENVGKTLLFFGCRRRNEDFLYESEWEEYKTVLQDQFDMITAFSRETSKKVYVQDRLKECAAEVDRLLKKNAHIFVCGDAANMAHGVRQVLVDIVSEQRQILRTRAEETVKMMKTTGKYQDSRRTYGSGSWPICTL